MPGLSRHITEELKHLSALIDSVEERDYSKLMINVENRIRDVKGRAVEAPKIQEEKQPVAESVQEVQPMQIGVADAVGGNVNLVYLLSSVVLVSFLGALFVMLGAPDKKSTVKLDQQTDRNLFKREVAGSGQKTRKRQAKERLVPKFEVVE